MAGGKGLISHARPALPAAGSARRGSQGYTRRCCMKKTHLTMGLFHAGTCERDYFALLACAAVCWAGCFSGLTR